MDTTRGEQKMVDGVIERIKVGLVVPTNRPEHFARFLKEWHYLRSTLFDVTLYIVEDNPTKKIKVPELGCKYKHFTHKTIQKDLGNDSWIIPTHSSAIRSYGYLKAYQDGCEYILTLDDDCYPTSQNADISSLIYNHYIALTVPTTYSGYFSVGQYYYPNKDLEMRGYPFTYRANSCAVMSVGGWNYNPDLDAVTQLSLGNPNLNIEKWGFTLVPKYLGVTLCGMNIMFRRDVIPISYFLLQGKEWGIDRWDDIWFGLFAKKILDQLSMPIAINSTAKIHHDRASNPLKNLYPEGIGYGANEQLWDKLMSLQLEGDNIYDLYEDLAYKLPENSLHDVDYTLQLKCAMAKWISLFQKQ